MTFDEEFQEFVKRGCAAHKAVDQLGAGRKKVGVTNIEAAAKALAKIAEVSNADEVHVVLGGDDDIRRSLFLYVKEDPEKVRLILDLLKAWEKRGV